MPFTTIENSGKGNNTGSCRALANYLCKENEGKSLDDQEHFFSHSEERVNRLAVIKSIDGNTSKLGKNDSKFFMVTLNFSEVEIAHIGNDPAKIKAYTKHVMELYAANFNKGLHSSDLVWFAKIEFNRSFKGFEEEVKNGDASQGQLKPGLNTHVHLIISRKGKTQKLKLSPMTNHRKSSKGVIKGGFDRTNFKIQCEKSFDELFQYNRSPEDHFIVANTLKNGTREQKVHVKHAMYKNENPLAATLTVLESAVIHYPTPEEETLRSNKQRHSKGYQR